MARKHLTQIERPACHEVALHHADGSFECAGGDCVEDLRVHRFVVACTEVDCAECEGVVLAA